MVKELRLFSTVRFMMACGMTANSRKANVLTLMAKSMKANGLMGSLTAEEQRLGKMDASTTANGILESLLELERRYTQMEHSKRVSGRMECLLKDLEVSKLNLIVIIFEGTIGSGEGGAGGMNGGPGRGIGGPGARSIMGNGLDRSRMQNNMGGRSQYMSGGQGESPTRLGGPNGSSPERRNEVRAGMDAD